MKLRQEERVQLPSVHLTDVEIPTNLIKSNKNLGNTAKTRVGD